ncbi:MAG: BamA/TamA family outer membrane protein [Planctomycetes bacterium]|nr:BamA/TamA family outer membrane protein [Planctomycetota bacterium]
MCSATARRAAAARARGRGGLAEPLAGDGLRRLRAHARARRADRGEPGRHGPAPELRGQARRTRRELARVPDRPVDAGQEERARRHDLLRPAPGAGLRPQGARHRRQRDATVLEVLPQRLRVRVPHQRRGRRAGRHGQQHRRRRADLRLGDLHDADLRLARQRVPAHARRLGARAHRARPERALLAPQLRARRGPRRELPPAGGADGAGVDGVDGPDLPDPGHGRHPAAGALLQRRSELGPQLPRERARPEGRGRDAGGWRDVHGRVDRTAPEALGSFTGALFVDAGNVGLETGDYLDFSGVRYGVGPGVRWLLPIGPLRVDWGLTRIRRRGKRIGWCSSVWGGVLRGVRGWGVGGCRVGSGRGPGARVRAEARRSARGPSVRLGPPSPPPRGRPSARASGRR